MKLLSTLTLILCSHIPQMHSAPFIEDQKHRQLALIGIATTTASFLFIEAVGNLRDMTDYDHKIEEKGLTAKRIDKRDAACMKATVNLIASALLLGISSLASYYTAIDFDSLGN